MATVQQGLMLEFPECHNPVSSRLSDVKKWKAIYLMPNDIPI